MLLDDVIFKDSEDTIRQKISRAISAIEQLRGKSIDRIVEEGEPLVIRAAGIEDFIAITTSLEKEKV